MPGESGAPLVTIGMPIYNEERFLESALTSLRSQDYENIQILISDNASTDRSGEIARRVAEDDTRIRYSSTGENIGAAANFRHVADMADGKYFMWAAGHDEWSEDLISDSVAVLESNEGASLAFASSYWIDESGKREDRDTDYPDTRDMSLASRFFTVFWGNMHPVLGVMRLSHLRQIKNMQDFAGSDLVLLSDMVLMGDFVHAPNAYWHRRDVRSKESHAERLQRYAEEDPAPTRWSIDKSFPLLKLPFALIGTIWNARISWLQKALLSIMMLPQLPIRYIVGRRKANKLKQ